MSLSRESKIEGYWYSEHSPQYPIPVANDTPWNGQQEFVRKVSQLQQLARMNHYKGWSTCRICNEENGSTEYEYKGWRWPSGYLHYITVHNVKPSDEFFNFVMGEQATPKQTERKLKTSFRDSLSPHFLDD